MLAAVDLRTALEVGSTLLTGVTVVATMKNDIRWIKRWMREHQHTDDESFKRVDTQLAELRTHQINHPQELFRS